MTPNGRISKRLSRWTSQRVMDVGLGSAVTAALLGFTVTAIVIWILAAVIAAWIDTGEPEDQP